MGLVFPIKRLGTYKGVITLLTNPVYKKMVYSTTIILSIFLNHWLYYKQTIMLCNKSVNDSKLPLKSTAFLCRILHITFYFTHTGSVQKLLNLCWHPNLCILFKWNICLLPVEDCPRIWDGVLCWPDEAPGLLSSLPCPAYVVGFNPNVSLNSHFLFSFSQMNYNFVKNLNI